jgi:hypothetical protein
LACSLLDVAVGSGSGEMTKYMLEFNDAKPTQETLKQSRFNWEFRVNQADAC